MIKSFASNTIRFSQRKRREIKNDLLSKPVYSPIVSNHEVAKHHDLPKDWAYWEKIDFMFIDACQELWVLMMEGWEESKGVQAEIKYAQARDIPIKYIPYGENK